MRLRGKKTGKRPAALYGVAGFLLQKKPLPWLSAALSARKSSSLADRRNHNAAGRPWQSILRRVCMGRLYWFLRKSFLWRVSASRTYETEFCSTLRAAKPGLRQQAAFLIREFNRELGLQALNRVFAVRELLRFKSGLPLACRRNNCKFQPTTGAKGKNGFQSPGVKPCL